MTIPLKQNTASQEVPLGPFVDSTDGVTIEASLTVAASLCKVWVAGGTTLADCDSAGTYISNGIYYVVLASANTATAGPLVIFANVTGALPCKAECIVYPSNIYDSLFSTDKLDVNVAQINGTTVAGDGSATPWGP